MFPIIMIQQPQVESTIEKVLYPVLATLISLVIVWNWKRLVNFLNHVKTRWKSTYRESLVSLSSSELDWDLANPRKLYDNRLWTRLCRFVWENAK